MCCDTPGRFDPEANAISTGKLRYRFGGSSEKTMARKPYAGRLTRDTFPYNIIRKPRGAAAQAACDLTAVVWAKGGLS
jgi:hypothetical protein